METEDGGDNSIITTKVEAKEMNEPSMAPTFGVKSKRQSPILGAEAKKLPHTEVAEEWARRQRGQPCSGA
ncbi:hypothetical protein E4U32_004465 [Claviceps aff. humidiphila group G2b]|nr:hypothetical protein E4U32_004465 [Claviceps aff. humidiphila group G2b]